MKEYRLKLVVAGLISSEAGKKGGVSLKMPPEKITLLDIFEAIEGKEPFAKATGLVERVFLNELKEVKEQKQAMILEAFNQAELSYKEKLKTITLKMAMVERKKDSLKFIIYIKIFELCKIEKSYIQKVYSFFKKFSCNY